MNNSSNPNIAVAIKFLTTLFKPTDVVLFRPMETWTEGGKKRSQVAYKQVCHREAHPLPLELAMGHLLNISERERLNLFFGVCPRFGGHGKFDKAWQIRTVRALWVDVDKTSIDEVRERIAIADIPEPSIIVNSGNGAHVYWLLDEPYLIDDVGDPIPVELDWPDLTDPKTGKKPPRPYIIDPSNRERLYQDVPSNRPNLSERAVLLQDMVSGLADRIGGDHTQDVSRLLRIPGSMNRKNERHGTPPVPCTLELLDESRRYSFQDFEKYAEKAPTRRDREAVEKVKLPTPRPMTPAKTDKLNEMVLACATASDRSRADWALVCRAIEKGWPQDAVWNEVKNVGKFLERGESYFLNTWAKAGLRTRKVAFDKCRQEHDGEEGYYDEDGGDEDVSTLSAASLATSICADDHFAQDPGGKLYHFAKGVYRPGGEQIIKARVKGLCKSNGCDDDWSSKLANETVEYIKVDSPQLWERPPSDVLNVTNGLLDVSTRKLKPHSPEWLSPVQIPVKFDPAATCPKIDKFCRETFPEDNLTLAYEFVAWLMLPDSSIQKAVLLIGEGGNGKSRYLKMVQAFLGRSNVSSQSLHRLEEDRFACGRLVGKLANICPDLPSKDLVGTSVFKAITGGDTLTGEHKFHDSFDFTPFCRLLFSANHPPRADDASEGFFDRWLVVPFDRRFRGENGEVPSEVLDAMLREPGELSGLLNRALSVLQGLRKRGRFSESESTRAAYDDFRARTDPIAVWLDSHTITNPSALTLQSTLLAAYNGHCVRAGTAPTTKQAFGQRLHKLRPDVIDRQRTVNGKPNQWCYVGIGLRNESQDAQSA